VISEWPEVMTEVAGQYVVYTVVPIVTVVVSSMGGAVGCTGTIVVLTLGYGFSDGIVGFGGSAGLDGSL
jgi:phage-related minor tail protein